MMTKISINWGFSVNEIKVKSGDGRNFKIIEAFTYTTQSGEVITVPVCAKSDGFSTPRILWRLIPPFGKGWKAAVLHDYLYRKTQIPKKKCDAILYEAMLYLKVNKTQAKIIYDGVVYGGSKSFRDDRADQKKAA